MQDLINNVERMTSIEIAEVTGKPHNDVLKAIRKMEPAWEKVCLYIATKFNDEARAKLVLRWEQLERENLFVH